VPGEWSGNHIEIVARRDLALARKTQPVAAATKVIIKSSVGTRSATMSWVSTVRSTRLTCRQKPSQTSGWQSTSG
jgi:hypothetical protein